MQAAVFEGNGVLRVKEVPKPSIQRGNQVLLRIKAASICGSDLQALRVPPGQIIPPGTIMGHEFCGEVVEIGADVHNVKVGDYVVVDTSETCGMCEPCRAGFTNLCEHRTCYGQTGDGGFAEYAVMPAHLLYAVPRSIPPYLAAQAEPLACVLNGMTKINPTPADRVVVYGAGPIGLTFIRLLSLYGVRQIAICQRSEARRQLALECGATLGIDPATQDVRETLLSEWGAPADIVIDTAGAGSVPGEALGLLKFHGILLLFGGDQNVVSSLHPAELVWKELRVFGSFCAHNTFGMAIELLQNPDLGLEKFLSARMKLSEINQAMELLRSRKANRIVIYPDSQIEN